MKNITVAIALLQLLTFGKCAFADGNGLPAIMDHFSKVTKSQVEYKEVKHLSIVKSPLVSKGILSYISPDTLIQEVTYPRSERYEIRGDRVVTYKDGAKSESFTLSEIPALRAFIESFRAVLSGNIKELNDYYEIWFSGTAKQWQMRLVPRNKRMKGVIDRIVIKGDDTNVKTIAIYETGGDWSQMELTPVAN